MPDRCVRSDGRGLWAGTASGIFISSAVHSIIDPQDGTLSTMKRLVWIGGVLVGLATLAISAAPTLVENFYNRLPTHGPYTASSQAERLQRSLLIADLHCDSLLWGRDLLRHSATGHVDLPRLVDANVALQAFTVVTQVPLRPNAGRNDESFDMLGALAIAERWPPRTWNSPKQRALYQASQLHSYAASSNGRLIIIKSASDLKHFLENRTSGQRVAAFLGVEGAQPLEGRLENLKDLYAAGFRMMAPTHFTDTAVGGSASGVRQMGLTPLGREWVRQMEAKSMLIDLAHASAATLQDITSMATKPLVVSHTGVKGTCNNNRNLSDEQLSAVARTGGVVGIGYWEKATCGRDAEAVARAISHAVNVIGAEHVALGSDFDGATTMPFDVTGLPLIIDALIKEGISEREIRLIMGGNTVRVLLQTLPQ
jgi:membrane dipeptidase